jgi:SAM-dependent methyltransferase
MSDFIKCPICGEKTFPQKFKVIYKSPFNNKEYKCYSCLNCEVDWWEPLKMVREFYEDEIFTCYVNFHEETKPKLFPNHLTFFKNFPQNIRGRLLDIGCGNGAFLKAAKEAGFEVWGIDFDSKSIRMAKKIVNVDTLYPMSLEEFCKIANQKKLKFDVITFFEVLEHQDKPKKFLQLVKSLLKENGFIAGSVPNRDRLFGEDGKRLYIHEDYPPHHFLRFSQTALKKCLEINKFQNIIVLKTDFLFKDLFPYLERRYFGNFDKLKVKLKTFAGIDRKMARGILVDDLERYTGKNWKVYMLKFLKIARIILLLPFSLIYLKSLKGNGHYLYFQATN